MYSRILVAVDNTSVSKCALQEAIQLAKDQKAKLRIVYVADAFVPGGEGVPINFKEYESSIRKEGRSILDEMVKIARKNHDQVESHLIEVTEENTLISRKILDEAKKWKADLIVLGTHGRTGLTRLLLGSVAEEVTRQAIVPVQVVHEKNQT